MENIYVATLEEMYNIINPLSNAIYYCEENHKDYIYHSETKEWEQLANITQETSDTPVGSIDLYTINQSLMAEQPVLSEEQIWANEDTLNSFEKEFSDYHYMLLCRELNYYTVFEYSTEHYKGSFGQNVLDIISSLGEVYSIDMTSSEGAVEIWVKPTGEALPHVYYLFPYEAGVVYYE